jgi:transposase
MERSTVHLLHKRGKSLRTIASELGRSKSTIARALSEPVDRQPEKRQRTSNVDPFREQIAEWLKQGLSGVRMLELARDDPDHPYRGGSSVWRAAVRRERLNGLHEQAVADVPIRFEGLPGEYLQVDWGEIRHFPFTQQQPVTRYFLACRLKYSRWTWVIFTDNMRQETLFRGLVACFNALGFVPWVLVFDNMKTVTTGRDEHAQPIWHRSLLQLAAEFDFHLEACWPASGNQKDHAAYCTSFNRSVCKSRAWRLANRNPLRGSGPDLTSIIECLVLATHQTLCAEPDRARPRRHAADVCQRRSCACIGGSPSRSRTSTDRGQDQRVGNGGSQVCHSGRIADGR